METGWTAQDIPDLAGRTAIVTGANSGLGYETAFQLAAHGARTVLACRDVERGNAAADRMRRAASAAKVEVMALDLASLASVRAFAQVFKAKASRLDVLVNNAGVMAIPRRTTADGFEMQFGTNYLGHFALTGLMLESLVASGAGRVVSVSSLAGLGGRIALDDLQGVRRYRKWSAYMQSKLANLVFSLEFQRRLAARGLPVISAAAHPGYTATNLQFVASAMTGSRVGHLFYALGNRLLGMRPQRGALSILYCAVSPGVKGGEYIGPRGLFGMWGLPGPAHVSGHARDELGARRLWEASEELTNVKYEALARAA